MVIIAKSEIIYILAAEGCASLWIYRPTPTPPPLSGCADSDSNSCLSPWFSVAQIAITHTLMSATSNLSVCVGLEYSLWASSYSSLPSSLVICIAGHRCHSIRLVAANARFAVKNWRHFCCNKVNIKAAKLAPSAGATTINSCKSAHTGLWRNGSLFSDPNILSTAARVHTRGFDVTGHCFQIPICYRVC